LLMIDLDRFKEINDTLGHQAGDHVLCTIGTRLTAILRRSDTVARLGGDEFAILLPDACLRQAQTIAQLVGKTIEQPLRYQERELPIGASIGIALFPDHGMDAETLFKHADVAMYVAKQNGAPYSVYNPQQDRHSIGRLAMISELRSAIAADELLLHYQPKIDMRSGELAGVEALLRWPQWSAIPTEYLIKTAERTSLIRQLTFWVLRSALAQAMQWRANGSDFTIAVNLSTWLLGQDDIVTVIESLLTEYGLPAERLELEITENAMMKNPEQARAMLDRLHALGIRLTVDDYGTGYSSLAHLKSMPVDCIKIDRSFVGDMVEDENAAVIVRSTIDLAHNLGLRVVAEGVSSQEVWDVLEILGCDTAQGYFIAQPMPADSLERWLVDGGHTPDRRQDLRA
ncbi:MAG: putative bifunctional diguanylate cyclase/phosphodiesterase, partial [Gammaproteobacteria bacterium]